MPNHCHIAHSAVEHPGAFALAVVEVIAVLIQQNLVLKVLTAFSAAESIVGSMKCSHKAWQTKLIQRCFKTWALHEELIINSLKVCIFDCLMERSNSRFSAFAGECTSSKSEARTDGLCRPTIQTPRMRGVACGC